MTPGPTACCAMLLTIVVLSASAAKPPTAADELSPVNETGSLGTNERHRRLIPYMTFYLTNDYRLPVNQAYSTPQTSSQDKPQYADAREPRYRYNKNGRPTPTGYSPQKITFTPFAPSNKLPGEFTPIQVHTQPNNFVQKPYKVVQPGYHPQTTKVYTVGKFNQYNNGPAYRRPQHQPQYGDRQVPLQHQHSGPHQTSAVRHQQPPATVLVHYNGNYVNYVPQPAYEPEPYTRPQTYENVKQYQTLPTAGESQHQAPKYPVTYSGGFHPIAVTTLSPLPPQAVPQGFSVTPRYKQQYPRPVEEDTYETEDDVYESPKYHTRPNNDDNAHLKYQTATESYEPPATQIPQQVHVEEEDERLKDSRNSLSIILKKLQESNTLPHTLTADNIDNSIKTLVQILNNLKQTHKNVEVSTQTPVRNYQIKPIQTPVENVHDEEIEEDDEHLEELDEPHSVNLPGPSSGRPGIDYPTLSEIPETSFNCKEQRYKGFFGDPDTNCQVWHYCDLNGGQASFLCPNGTIFSQVALTCDWWFNVKCSTTTQLYVLNERLYKYILPFTPKFPEDYSGPLVDKYLAIKFREMEDKMKKRKKADNPVVESEKAEVIEIKPNGEPLPDK